MLKLSWLYAVLCLGLSPALLVAAPSPDAKPSGMKFAAARGSLGFQSRLERAVGLTPEQQETVRGLLAQQRQDLQTLRDEVDPKFAAIQERTDSKIRGVLNPEQQKKFDNFLAKQKQERKARKGRKAA